MHTLGSFLDRLEKHGELKRVPDRVSWDLEAAAVATRVAEAGGPALLFENVTGYSGAQLASGLLAGPGMLYPQARKPWSRLAIALGVSPDVGWEELISTLLDRQSTTVRAARVSSGSCKQVVLTGNQASVEALPVPRLHGGDGGRYGNRHVMIVRDPETGAVHWGAYRWCLKEDGQVVLSFPPDSGIAAVHSKYEQRKEAMPLCIVMGGNPAITVAAYMGAQPGADVAGLAGSLGLEPIQLVTAETADLLVPADAEVVIEGSVPPGVRADEGPFPDFTAFQAVSAQPVLAVSAITHRRNPIFPFAVEAAKHGDSLVLTSILHSAMLTQMCRLAAAPVRWVMCPQEARMGLCTVATRVPYNGYLWQIAKYIFSWSTWFDKILFVDYEINPDEQIQCYNDMVNKANPTRAWRRSDMDARVPLVAKYPTPEGTTSRLQINAIWDPNWPKEWRSLRISFEDNYPEDVRQRVLERWAEFGFGKKPVVVTRPA